MSAEQCPFLSKVKGNATSCVKNAKSKGVCTISARSNGPRQDWVACPYRVFDPQLIEEVSSNLYGSKTRAFAGPRLADAATRIAVLRAIDSGKKVLVYFDHKIGGEVSVAGTARSPEMAFDVTLVELRKNDEQLELGKFAILEVQTMDFHGSYSRAVGNLRSALQLHGNDFAAQLKRNEWWTGDGIEGPNIANVFKRTFYQMMFKFHFGLHDSCAGTALMISASVWDSWQPFLAAPTLKRAADGTFRLLARGERLGRNRPKAWIHVFDIDDRARTSLPRPVRFVRTIGLTADTLGILALREAPAEAAQQLVSAAGIYSTLQRRLSAYWPERDVKVAGPVLRVARNELPTTDSEAT